jgi:hypothetical protein
MGSGTISWSNPAGQMLVGPISGNLGVGDYLFTFTGTSPSPYGGASTGSLTFNAAVPEPGTWAMMLLGFGAIGMVMRGRRRRPALAQIA